MATNNLIGQSLGQYELRELLGAGGMGAVYSAYQANLKRAVAVKVLSGNLALQSGSSERFNREAEIAATLEHPHIVPIVDYGTQDGISYVVMRLLTGGTLSEHMRHRFENNAPPPSLSKVAHLLIQLAGALDYAHKRAVIHRDIKPSNIMFDSHGNAYIVDFGIAKILEGVEGAANLTGTGMTMGTPTYMSPEQWKAESISAAADQYALAVMAYELITQRVPFEASTPYALMNKHLNESPTPAHAFRTDVPEAMNQVLEKALAKAPGDRFPSVTAFAQAFVATIRDRKTPSRGFLTSRIRARPNRTAPLGAALDDQETTIGKPIPAAASAWKNRWLLLMGGAALAIVLAIIAFLLIGGSDKGNKEAEADAPVEAPLGTATAGFDGDTLPPVKGFEPSYRVAAFYYSWYGNPSVNGAWREWNSPSSFSPPNSIGSDYYPELGAYSSLDPEVIAAHFAWLREAGVGVVITSWWGQDSYEEQAVRLLLEMGERYKIKVAFLMELYAGRSNEQLVEDITNLYNRYGSSSAFYRTESGAGLFFVQLVEFAAGEDYQEGLGPRVDASYWQDALDEIHTLPGGALVIANATDPIWIAEGHFDGLYNSPTLQVEDSTFAWAQGLPSGAWYIPTILPGFSGRRSGFGAEAYLPRDNGAVYADQWSAVLNTGVEPQMVAISTFNNWHNGTQIEPIAEREVTPLGDTYTSYGALATNGYLVLTRDWVERFLTWTWEKAAE